jgi:hypothetical protein
MSECAAMKPPASGPVTCPMYCADDAARKLRRV